MKKKSTAAVFAILAAALYAINIPISKMLLKHVDSTMMAALLYLGAGLGMLLCDFSRRALGKKTLKDPLTRKELPYAAGMVVLDIAAPILLMMGISRTASANVSLLNNFEIVATSLIALLVFKERISKRLWLAIGLVTAASIILSFEGEGALRFNTGSLFVLGACVCWGFENNCTRMISNKSSEEIVIIKGLFSGLGSLIIARLLGESLPEVRFVLVVMTLGFVAYGLSINFYIMAQKELGAAKTSAYYSAAPFLGAVFGILILHESPSLQFYFALAIMALSAFLMVNDTIELQHTHKHSHTHCHEHCHGDIVHTHEHTHSHSHIHVHENGGENHHHVSGLNDHDHIHPGGLKNE